LTIGWGLISISSFESKITIIYGVGFTIEVMVLLRKFNVASTSSSNSLFLCSCSKTLVSSIVHVCEANNFT
jgi:hypothetical protein